MTALTRGRKPDTIPAASDALDRTPPAPAWLAPHARAEWKRVAPILVARGTITKADLGMLESYCAAAGSARQIAEALATMSLPDPKLGGLQIRYATLARQLAAEFGLSPVSRTRIGADPEQHAPDARPNPLSFRR